MRVSRFKKGGIPERALVYGMYGLASVTAARPGSSDVIFVTAYTETIKHSSSYQANAAIIPQGPVSFPQITSNIGLLCSL